MCVSIQDRIIKMTTSPVEKVQKMAKALLNPDRTFESMVRGWHVNMGSAVRNKPTTLTNPDIERRLRLTLEKVIETVVHSGFTIVSKKTNQDILNDLKLVPVDGKEQNLVEIAKGLCDTIVVCLCHAAEHGILLTPIFEEIMLSNGTKLPLDGIVVVNRCVSHETNPSHDYSTNSTECVLLDSAAPIGKILKPANYLKADIAGVLEAQMRSDTNQQTFVFEDGDKGKD